MLYFIAIYLGIQFGIGYWASTRVKSEADYLLAGRSVPAYLLIFSLFATWFGAETCIGTSGEVYKYGLAGARADPFGYTLCLILMGLLIAPKIWNQKYSTLADFYKDRFGSSSEKISVLILLLGSLVWGAAQIRAFGQIIASTTNLPILPMMVVGFVIVVSYSLLGGLMGDIYTDFIQGIILIVGLLFLIYYIYFHEGSAIFAISTERLNLVLENESFWERLDRWAIPILGSLIAQESIARVLAASNKNIATKASYLAGILYLFVGAIPVILGLIGINIFTSLEDSEHFLMLLSVKYLPQFLQWLLSAALISAILSTVDSIMLAAGSLFSHNLLFSVLKIKSEKKKLLISRLSVVFVAIISLVVALFSESIYGLVESASSFGTAGVLVITILGLWTNLGSQKAAVSTLLIGVFFYPFATYVLEWSAPFLGTLTASLVTYIVVAYIEHKQTL